MSNEFTQDFWTSLRKVGDGNTRIGQINRLWYDPKTNTIRRHNGQPGGLVIGATIDPSGGLLALNVVSSNTVEAEAGNLYVLTSQDLTTVILPSDPVVANTIAVTVSNQRLDNVISGNGNNIIGINEDLTLDLSNAVVRLRYANPTLGWVFS